MNYYHKMFEDKFAIFGDHKFIKIVLELHILLVHLVRTGYVATLALYETIQNAKNQHIKTLHNDNITESAYKER